MGHVAVSGDDLEALDGFFVADYVAQVDGAVFLDPGRFVLGGGVGRISRGKSTRGGRKLCHWCWL